MTNSSLAIAEAKRWYWQRISAMVLAVCVLVHLGQLGAFLLTRFVCAQVLLGQVGSLLRARSVCAQVHLGRVRCALAHAFVLRAAA